MGTLLKIISVFFKIGILTVGGGLAMIPVIQQEMERLGWLNSQQFLDILGVAQITPGAISVNTATFSGYTVMADAYPGQLWMACLGALAGTISVCMPSFFCVNIASQVWSRYREHDCMLSIFNIMRPLVTGLIITASAFLVVSSVCGDSEARNYLSSIDCFSVGVVICAFLLTVYTRMKPFYLLGLGIIAGIGYGLL